MFKHILVPTDGSPLATIALDNAIALASGIGSRLTVLYVVEPFHTFSLDPDQLGETQKSYEAHSIEWADNILGHAAGKARAASVACETLRVVADEPYRAIIETAMDRGVDLIVSETNEIQVAIPPYYIRTGVTGTGPSDRGAIPSLAGFSDWPYLRVEQRLASSPASGDDYVLTAWISFQAPTGIARLSSNAWTYTPTLAFGKGFGNFVVQGTVAAIFPAPTFPTGNQIQTNIAFQYHAWNVFWPEVEVNWTYYANGQRGGLNQVFLTTGVVIGRFSLTDTLHFTFGAGYLFAVAPTYQPKPQIPSYNHAWLFTTRMNF